MTTQTAPGTRTTDIPKPETTRERNSPVNPLSPATPKPVKDPQEQDPNAPPPEPKPDEKK